MQTVRFDGYQKIRGSHHPILPTTGSSIHSFGGWGWNGIEKRNAFSFDCQAVVPPHSSQPIPISFFVSVCYVEVMNGFNCFCLGCFYLKKMGNKLR
ncbi:hypothetical protein CDAR_367861 [Caerostris darwini]|uniref:Uncharacterized protein n=1 Tax=Caerostris darwini TaxID=1538125 RepID=A0AAV4R491_9ARAC|nr:hypothetical protein CDAR_367861 [Caerostris darwini]